MAIITFWSDANKQTGQTLSIAAIAANMAIQHNYKILLISTQYDDNTLEQCFGMQDKNRTILNGLVNNKNVTLDSGIEGLSRIANSGKIDPEIIQNYTHVVYRNRLEVLYGLKKLPNRETKEEYIKIKESYKDIIQNANKYYDIILVDLYKGIYDDVAKQILKVSDVIVYNIKQKINMIDQYTNIKDTINTKYRNNIVLNVGSFDENSKYTIKNISRYLGIKKDIVFIPYNTLYFEAADEAGVADFFLKIRKISDSDKNAILYKTVQDAAEKIIYKLQEVQMSK